MLWLLAVRVAPPDPPFLSLSLWMSLFVWVLQECNTPFVNGSFFEHEGKPLCEAHYHQSRGSLCQACQQPILGRCVTAMGAKFHPNHLVCHFCLKPLSKGCFKEQENKPYCHPCFIKLFGWGRRRPRPLCQRWKKKKKLYCSFLCGKEGGAGLFSGLENILTVRKWNEKERRSPPPTSYYFYKTAFKLAAKSGTIVFVRPTWNEAKCFFFLLCELFSHTVLIQIEC